jgi:hypothetical protein
MRYFLSYGCNKYTNAKKRILGEAINSEFFDKCNIYGPNDLSNEFKNEFNDILQYKKGAGYWIWKFYLIDKYLNETNDGDFIIYCDAGCTINKKGKERFEEYIKMLEESDEGILSFDLVHHIENERTIQELFDYFKIDINHEHALSGQYVGGILIIKNCNKSKQFINECFNVLKYNKYLITDMYNENQTIPPFIDARHDQSIFSLVRKKLGSLVIQEDETYMKNPDGSFNDMYPIWASRKM